MIIKTVSDFRGAIRKGKYAWPGGYPLFFVTADGEALSFEAAIAERRQVISAIGHDERHSGWRVVAVETNWEDTNLTCAHTGKLIESAYDGDPDPDIVRENRADLADQVDGYDRDDLGESPDY